MFSTVLLDVDGTLIDSNDQHALSWVDAFATEGIKADLEEVRRLIGMGGDRLMPKVSGIDEESPIGKRISERRGEIFREKYFSELRPFPKVREMILRMKDQGLQLCVASSSDKAQLGKLLQAAGVSDLLPQTTSKDDAESSKPAPDIIEAALETVGARARNAVMVGDTPYDIMAAKRAGVASIALRCGGWGDEDLAGAIAIYDDPADLLANFERSAFVGHSVGLELEG